MAMKQFKTESKRLLDLMANSIYTNTDIFLRELISNASDACDKRHILSLTDSSISSEDLEIRVEVDAKNKTIKISDNGIGMSSKDLEDNLGTIAKSGSFEFKQNLDEKQENDIIGQFGVGFYSAFMVADKVEVTSKKVNEDKAYQWSSDMNGYEIKEANKENFGTDILLHIKANTKEKKYDEYLQDYTIKNLIKKYSDFIRYPIKMELDNYKTGEDGKSKTVREIQTVNSMIPIWKKAKKDIKQEDYDSFYNNEFYDYSKPLKTIHYKVEGNTSYTALLYIPSTRPMNYFTNDYKLGLKLYSRGVFIKDEAKEIISDYFRFIKGVVDSDDLSLNISREILQQDYQMTTLKKSIDKKIKATLEKMLQEDKDNYIKFFENFGTQLKYGCYDNFGMNKDVLIDLLIFKSSKEDKYVTLKEYVDNMAKEQKEIYYATGESSEKIKQIPQIKKALDKGYEVLYFTDSVDEFFASMVREYSEKPFKSILQADFDSKDEKKELEKKTEDAKNLIEKMKEQLKDKVSDVKLSNNLNDQAVCLTSQDELSIEMEKVLKMMNQTEATSKKVLEINPNHELFISLKNAYDQSEDITSYTSLLYNQALLLAGLPIEDPIAYTKQISDLMVKAMK